MRVGSSGEREPCISCNLRAPSEIFGPSSLFIEVICTDHLPTSTLLELGRVPLHTVGPQHLVSHPEGW